MPPVRLCAFCGHSIYGAAEEDTGEFYHQDCYETVLSSGF